MRASAGERVLMLVENHSYPEDARVRREARSLSAAGHRVTVIAPAAGGQRLSETVDGVTVLRYPAPIERDGLAGYLFEYGYSMLAAWLLSLFVFVRGGFDVIHAHNPPDTFALVAGWYKLLGKRFVFDHHDLSPEMYEAKFGEDSRPMIKRALLLFERLTFRLADHVISTNESYRQIAIGRGGVSEDRVTVVRNGPDLQRVRLVEPDAEIRERASTIIAYVGVMGSQDGVDHLLDAIDHLVHVRGRDDVLCVIIGQGSAVPDLKSLARALNLDRHVWFTGRVSDERLMTLLSTADICVDPDPLNEFNDRSTMIKITEYLALGKPVVAFDLTEHRRTAADAAVYANPNDTTDFARCIEQLMDDPGARARMSSIGLRRVDEQLAWRHQERRLIEAYGALFPASGTGA